MTKRLKLKAVLTSENGGGNWSVSRQFYIADLDNERLLDSPNFLGAVLRLESRVAGAAGPTRETDHENTSNPTCETR